MAITERTTPRRTIGSGLDVLTTDIELPPWARIRQQLDATDIGSIPDAIAREFAKPGIGDRIQPGNTVWDIGAGSGSVSIEAARRAASLAA